MSGYRLYLFDGARRGHRRRTRIVPLFCETETEALRHADKHRGGQYAELWHQEHLVKVFDPD